MIIATDTTSFSKTISLISDKIEITTNQVQSLIKEGLIELKDLQVFIYANPYKLDIIYEDDDILLINKSAGITVHPGIHKEENTLIPLLIKHYPPIINVGEQNRPGIVHRLDKGTSGIMIIAKNNLSYQALVSDFKEHQLKKIYEAITLKKEIPLYGKINFPIIKDKLKMKISSKGSPAITHYKLINSYEKFLHLRLELITGKTHQIRVHLSHIKLRIINDILYGNPKQDRILIPNLPTNYPYPFLYAKSLTFNHPTTKKELHFEITSPTIFKTLLPAHETF